MFPSGGRALIEVKRASVLPTVKLRIPGGQESWSQTVGAKLHWSKGEQPRPPNKVLKSLLSVKGGKATYTTRRLA
jgi:hypothetical protein